MTTSLLTVSELNKQFGDFHALKDIHFEFPKGKIIGLLGRNGAGKTTLMKTILGLYTHQSGSITWSNDPLKATRSDWISEVGALVDVRFHEDLTAYDNLKLLTMITKNFDRRQTRARIQELLRFVDLEDAKNQKVKHFSFGMKQRLALAQALIAKPKLLILDEPFVGLDPLGIQLVQEKIQYLAHSEEVTVIFSSHQLAEVEALSEYLMVIESGELKYYGPYDQVVNTHGQICLNLSLDLSSVKDVLLKIDSFNHPSVKIEGTQLFFEKEPQLLRNILNDLCEQAIQVEGIEIYDNGLIELFKHHEDPQNVKGGIK